MKSKKRICRNCIYFVRVEGKSFGHCFNAHFVISGSGKDINNINLKKYTSFKYSITRNNNAIIIGEKFYNQENFGCIHLVYDYTKEKQE